jgi:nucleotide-binding universal stress UspA family protein
MRKVLVPFDGSASARRAIQYLIETHRSEAPFQVHVLNVQERPIFLDGYLDAAMEEVERALRDAAQKLVLEAAMLLQRASIPHQLHAEVGGTVAEAIVQRAEDLKCDQIVMGTRGLGTLSGLVLGSIANKVVHLAGVPVTLVK